MIPILSPAESAALDAESEARGVTTDSLMENAGRAVAQEAAVLGCFLHGLAGDVAARRLGMWGLIAGDIVRALPAAITALESGALGET